MTLKLAASGIPVRNARKERMVKGEGVSLFKMLASVESVSKAKRYSVPMATAFMTQSVVFTVLNS